MRVRGHVACARPALRSIRSTILINFLISLCFQLLLSPPLPGPSPSVRPSVPPTAISPPSRVRVPFPRCCPPYHAAHARSRFFSLSDLLRSSSLFLFDPIRVNFLDLLVPRIISRSSCRGYRSAAHGMVIYFFFYFLLYADTRFPPYSSRRMDVTFFIISSIALVFNCPDESNRSRDSIPFPLEHPNPAKTR